MGPRCGCYSTLPSAPCPATGTWSWIELVTDASGVCSGEVNDLDTDQVTITQTGGDLTLTGIIGLPLATLHGVIYPPQGTELARIKLTGSEVWNWTGGGGTCAGITSITATKP